jgi:peptidoglycan/LPS O-acetylase OafA/YrhL
MLFHFFFLLEVGWIGVQIFFVLSGFLITGILLNSKTHRFADYVKRFYWRRALRIFPLYYVYLLGVVGIYFVANTPDNFLQKAPFLFTYTFNYYPLFYGYDYDAFFTHLWSLSVEEQFYLVWPFIIFFLSLQKLRYLVLLVVFSSPIIRYALGHFLYNPYQDVHVLGEIVYRLTLSHVDAFAIGAAIPLFKLDSTIKNKFVWLILLSTVLVAIGAANVLLSAGQDNAITISSLGYPIGGMENLQHIWSYTVLNVWSGALILYISSSEHNGKHLLIKLLETRFMVTIGKISYGMYVYHWVIFILHKKFFHDALGSPLFSFAIYFAIVFIISYLSFYFFEKRFLVFKDRFNYLPKVEQSSKA